MRAEREAWAARKIVDALLGREAFAAEADIRKPPGRKSRGLRAGLCPQNENRGGLGYQGGAGDCGRVNKVEEKEKKEFAWRDEGRNDVNLTLQG